MKWCYYILLVLLLCTSCRKDSVTELPEQIDIKQLFQGRLSDTYIRALIRMDVELNYSTDQLILLGETLERCMLDISCISSSHSPQEISDFKKSLRQETLPDIFLNTSSNDFWDVTYSDAEALLVFNHKLWSLAVNIDLDDGLDDGKNVGIYPVINGTSYATEHNERVVNLVRPTTDAGPIDRINVELQGEKIAFRFEGGRYGDLNGSNDTSTVFLDGTLQVINQKVQMRLEGLYYVLLPKGQTLVEYSNGSQTDSFTVTPESEFTFYRENVRLLKVSNVFPGNLVLNTDVQRLQFDSRAGTPNFELDFDHTFKDRGQKITITTLKIDELLKG